MGISGLIIAGAAANPPDVLAALAAGATIWLLAWPQIRRERRKAADRRDARRRERQIQADVDRAAARTGQLDAIGRTVYAPLPDGEVGQ